MIKPEYKEVYTRFLKVFGEDAQYRICIEEMSELTKELCHLMRLQRSENTPEILEKLERVKKNIIEETADVLNVVESIQFMFGENEVDRVRAEKVERSKRLYLDDVSKGEKH